MGVRGCRFLDQRGRQRTVATGPAMRNKAPRPLFRRSTKRFAGFRKCTQLLNSWMLRRPVGDVKDNSSHHTFVNPRTRRGGMILRGAARTESAGAMMPKTFESDGNPPIAPAGRVAIAVVERQPKPKRSDKTTSYADVHGSFALEVERERDV